MAKRFIILQGLLAHGRLHEDARRGQVRVRAAESDARAPDSSTDDIPHRAGGQDRGQAERRRGEIQTVVGAEQVLFRQIREKRQQLPEAGQAGGRQEREGDEQLFTGVFQPRIQEGGGCGGERYDKLRGRDRAGDRGGAGTEVCLRDVLVRRVPDGAGEGG